MLDKELEKYYQKGGTYVIPVEVINVWMEEKKQLKDNWNKLKDYLFDLYFRNPVENNDVSIKIILDKMAELDNKGDEENDV